MPSAISAALGKERILKNLKTKNFAECRPVGTRQSRRHRFLDHFLCRGLARHSAKALPSARQMALGKGCFFGHFFPECPLSSAALGKAFAECIWGFAECCRHSAKRPNPVVIAALRGSTRRRFEEVCTSYDQDVDRQCQTIQSALDNIVERQQNMVTTFGFMIDEALMAGGGNEADENVGGITPSRKYRAFCIHYLLSLHFRQQQLLVSIPSFCMFICM